MNIILIIIIIIYTPFEARRTIVFFLYLFKSCQLILYIKYKNYLHINIVYIVCNAQKPVNYVALG